MQRLHPQLPNSPEYKQPNGAAFLGRVIKISGRGNETQLFIGTPDVATGRRSTVTGYAVTIKASVADVVMQLNAAGVHMDPVRTAGTYQIAENPQCKIA